jgi:hypothetical protein
MMLISIALVGLLNGYRASIEAHRSTTRRIMLRQLLQNKIDEIEKNGIFSVGQEEGVFANNPECEWHIESKKSELDLLFRLEVTVSGFGDSFTSVIYLKQNEPDSKKG